MSVRLVCHFSAIIAIQIIRETKGGDDGECRARRRTTVGWRPPRRTTVGWRPPRTTTQPCAHQRAELVFLFVWIAIGLSKITAVDRIILHRNNVNRTPQKLYCSDQILYSWVHLNRQRMKSNMRGTFCYRPHRHWMPERSNALFFV